MALVLADRVNETTTTAGTGTLTLAGAVSGYQSFSVIGNANTTYYTIVHQTANEWEVGIGTYTSAGTTLSRDTVLASSAGGTTKVTFSAGTKFVFCDYPAGRAVYLDTASNATIPGITLSGGTANGVAYLNGSKVLTTGSALTFDGTTLTTTNVKLASSGSIVDGGGNAVLTPTSGGSVALTSNGAYTNGNIVYNALAATGVHVFSVNTAEQMRLTSTGLGIGTSSPGTKLDVNGTVRIRAGNTLYFQNAAADANGTITASGGAGSSDLAINASGGNVGIGTSSPGVRLDVYSSSTTAARVEGGTGAGLGAYMAFKAQGANSGYIGTQSGIVGSGTSNNLSLYAAGSNSITLWTGGIQTATLDSSGNLGIGTSSPGYKLQVLSGATAATSYFSSTATPSYSATAYNGGNARASFVGGSASGATTGINFSQGGSFEAYFGGVQESGGAAAFVWQGYSGAAYAERMRLDSSGNLGIGTASPVERLQVSGGGLKVTGASTVASGSGAGLYLNYVSGSNYGEVLALDQGVAWKTLRLNAADIQFYIAGGEQMRLNTSGNLGLGVTPSAWDTTASRALQLNGGSLWGYSTSQINLMQNAYYDAAGNFVYVNTAAASGYRQISGTHRWTTAASGTAGTTATFTTSMLIDGSGNLGIGTTSPSYKLHVSNGGAAGVEINPTGGISSGAFLQCYNRSTSVYVPFTTYASEIYWAISGSEKMRLDTSGNLGIGTSSPSEKLSVAGNTTADIYKLRSNTSAPASTDAFVFRPADNTLAFGTASSERARIDSSGNFMVGTTSTYNSAKVSVNGDVEARGNIKTRYGAYGSLANGASLTLMSFASGSYGSQLDGVLVVEQRDDTGGNLTTSTYLVSGYGGAGANFSAVSTQNYSAGQSFTINSSTTSGGLVISITNTSGRTSTSVNYTFLALKGGASVTYAF